jgi:hypothetical protein
MNDRSSFKPRNEVFLTKMRKFLLYLLAFDVLLFVFVLGGYVHSGESYTTLVGGFGQILLVSSMLLGNQAQLHEENSKRNNRISGVILLCSFAITFYQCHLLGWF